MKTIVISDLHLTKKFDQKKFNFIKNLVSQGDRIIIDGDFWSNYSVTFADFINSKWSQLFPLLKSKKTTYIYGNHDENVFIDERYKLFADILAQKVSFTEGDLEFTVGHGHDIESTANQTSDLKFKIWRNLHIDERIRKPLEGALFKLINRLGLFKVLSVANSPAKSQINDKDIKNKVLISAHTHIPEIDKTLGFVNLGMIDHGLAWWLEIDKNEYELKSAEY